MSISSRRSKYIIIAIAAISVMIAAIFLYAVNPLDSVYAPKCIFHMVTGLQCPGCGSQRAIHALLHLDIAQALRYNALLVISIPFLTLLIAAWCLRKRIPRLYDKVNSQAVIWTVLAVIAAWWILRNCLNI